MDNALRMSNNVIHEPRRRPRSGAIVAPPKPHPPKDKVLNVRVSAAELESWQLAADADEAKLSEWIRRQCNAAARRKAGGK